MSSRGDRNALIASPSPMRPNVTLASTSSLFLLAYLADGWALSDGWAWLEGILGTSTATQKREAEQSTEA